MKILIAHNRYQHAGGEDAVMEDELTLLHQHGHEVITLERNNATIATGNKMATGLSAIWSQGSANEVASACASFRPDVIHCHNTFPLLSPSVYWAASKAKVPVVQTLHNFRLLCANAMLTRNGQPCEDCVGKLPWRGIVRRCYRDSATQSLALTSMLVVHRGIGTYQNKVTRYIALNRYCRDKFIEGGLPAAKIAIKPNFAPDPAPSLDAPRKGILFVGRLTPEKGVTTLLNAAALIGGQIDVIGDGPMASACATHPGINYLGLKSRTQVLDAMQRASCLVIPSLWYENMPRTVIEAFACGLPVVASRIGALAEMVDDRRTGLLFEPGNAHELAAALKQLQASPAEARQWGEQARAEYLAHYGPESNHSQLMGIYQEAINAFGAMPANG